MLIDSLRRHERDDTIRFWVERDIAVYWRSLMISSVVASPLIFIAPDAYVVATVLGIILALVNHRTFRLEMTATHVRLKGGVLTPSLRLPYTRIADIQAIDVQKVDDKAPIGTLLLKLTTGHALRLAGVVDPVEAASAFKALKAEAAQSAAREPWASRRAA